MSHARSSTTQRALGTVIDCFRQVNLYAKKLKKHTFILFFVFAAFAAQAQQTLHTQIVDPSIRTLTVRDFDGRIQQSPCLVLSSDMIADGQTLEIGFDQLSHETHAYSYTLLHLNADGTPSALSQNEYIRGFNSQDITDYEHSFNTQQLYTHYRLEFPSEDMQPLLSGNYALLVYEDGRREDVRLSVCFRIVEPSVSIQPTLRTNTDIELAGRYQQLDIDVKLHGTRVVSPEEVTLVVEQNGRTDNRAFGMRPTYIEPERLRWLNCKPLIFEGGNEYQHFDIASEYFMGNNVNHISFDHEEQAYHAQLFTSENRATFPYISEPDLDGQFVVNRERTDYDDVEADYMWVYFTLPADNPWLDGAVYLLGDAWQNSFTADNRMTYDERQQAYVCRTLLKQGGYQWQYALLTKQGRLSQGNGLSGATLQRTEGSHWQTGNTYRIYFYHRPFGSRYDRLIGVTELQ